MKNLRTFLAAALLCVPATAHASGFLVAFFGGTESNPTTASPTATYYNPAGLALGHGTHLFVEGMAGHRGATYDRPVGAIDHLQTPGATTAGTPTDAQGANAGAASLSNNLILPFVGVSSDLGVPNLGVGLAFYAPFGGSATWDQNGAFKNNTMFPGAQDGVQRWSIVTGEISSIYVSGAAAWRIPSLHLSLGAGASFVYSKVSLTRARNPQGTDDLVSGGVISEGRTLIEVTGNDLAASAGLMWEPSPTVRVGLSYQSQPGFGTQRLTGTITNKFGTAPVAASPIVFEEALPDVLRVGVRVRATPALELRVSGEYARWSKFQRQCVLDRNDPNAKCAIAENGTLDTAHGGAGVLANSERRWQDAFGVGAGGTVRVRPGLELSALVDFDSNAVPDARLDASLMDMNKIEVAAGVRWAVSPRFALSANLIDFVNFSRTVAPRDRDAMGSPLTFGAPSREPDGAGTYTQAVYVLDLGVETTF